MAAADLAQIPDVDIDSDGVFKYVLIRVHATAPSGAPAGESKEIVRGYKWAEYHGEGGAEGQGRGRRNLWAGSATAVGRGRGDVLGGDLVSGLIVVRPRRGGVREAKKIPWPEPGSPSPSAPAQEPPFSFSSLPSLEGLLS